MTHDIITLLCVAVPAALGWDAFRRWSQLSHGRLLATDKAQEQARDITALKVRVKMQADEITAAFKKLDTFATDGERLATNLQGLHDRFGAVEERSENTSANVASFINETRSQIESLQQRETMALAGLNAIGRRGIKVGI